ncbi:hypothetical protein [Streptomyces sp. NPDC018045]|uniref:hypothetical protein n=1 Tax=Streptomyces sp. NPDC018045 TaxID=3365037 RepID=UPI003799975A
MPGPTIRVIQLDTGPNVGRIALVSPYNADMVQSCKDLGGKWDQAAKCWHFDSRDEDRVRELAREVFGTDGSSADEADTVTVRYSIGGLGAGGHRLDRLILAGREIVIRRYRDEPPRLGQGVVLISGGFASQGGSTRYPSLAAEPGTVLEVRDIPRAAVPDDPRITIVDETIDVAALTAERARLAARIADIDAALARAGADHK